MIWIFLYIIQIFNFSIMKKAIHFFDLDRTLWLIETRPWIIDKNNPSKPLIRLSKKESTYILSGIYKDQENMIEYNGRSFWISDDMFEKIKKKRKKIELDDLGISFIEKTNPEYYNKVKFFIENIRHLMGEEDIDVGILSARYSVDNDNEILKVLKEKLNELGLEINKFYYTGDFYNGINTNKDNIDKMKILLEHLVGFHIEGNHFVPIKQNFYTEVHFYDDENQNINVANDIQTFLEEYLKNTEDEVFDRISEIIRVKEPTLYTHLITNNQLQRFATTKIKLNQPIRFSIKLEESNVIKNFKEFKKL
jgi:predicted RNA-binding protein YlxR (DUF448 family)